MRRACLVFLLANAYLAVAFGSISHELLLQAGRVALPLLGTALPLLGFAWTAPALLLLLHLHLLLSVRRHARAAPAFLLAGSAPPVEHGIAWALGWIVLVALPLGVLLLGQVVLLPFHHTPSVWWFRCLIAADLAFLWLLWPEPPRAATRRRALLLPTSAILVVAAGMATVPGEFLARPLDLWIGPEHSLPLLARNLAPRGKRFAGHGTGLDLAGRDLRYARLAGADLRRANLSAGALQGADLRGADLRGADLTAADLGGALLSQALLQGASAWRTKLQGTDLRRARLEGTYLRRIDLRGAQLAGAVLVGASIVAGRLEAADLRDAVLAGADLSQAQLLGADLRRASLLGAVLAQARLEGADLRGADARGADLRGARLWRARVDADPERRWSLADRRGLGVGAIADVPARLAQEAATMTVPDAEAVVRTRLGSALRDEPRPSAPVLPSGPEMPDPQALAGFLGDLACAEDGDHHFALGLARRMALDDPARGIAPMLAERLLADCPPAALLTPDDRRGLQALRR